MKFTHLLLLIIVLVASPQVTLAQPEKAAALLTIAEAYIEVRTGPGEMHPVVYVIDRGDKIVIHERKTNWYKISLENGRTGWANTQDMQQTLLASGERLIFNKDDKKSFLNRGWELGIMTGSLNQVPIISFYGARIFTPNISTELTFGQSISSISDSNVFKFNIVLQPFPEWSYSPFFTSGFGSIKIDRSATLTNPDDNENAMSQVGFGIKKYISRRFILRFEVNEYLIYSASNDEDKNEDIGEWKIGFAVFF